MVELEKELVEIHKMRSLLENTSMQLSQAQAQKVELESALDTLEKNDDAVYKATGGLFIKVRNVDAVKEIKATLELLDVKIQSLSKQKESLENKLQRLAKDIEEKTGGAGLGGQGTA